MMAHRYTLRPLTVTAAVTASDVAAAYHYPTGVTGKGYTCGIVELGGGYDPALFPGVTAVRVDAAANLPDGPQGADGEVQLDIEIVRAVAPDAAIRVYFAPNTDQGFLHGIQQAVLDGCDVLSISWGQAESQWAPSVLDQYDSTFLTAREAGCVVLCASGDSGSGDGTGTSVVDFPASSPNVVGCGGTRLLLGADGERSGEVTWNDNPRSSATGGGVSAHFPGRHVPDVAGNADPQTGYRVTVDGAQFVVGGTSAVAPLYAGLVLLLSEAVGGPVGKRVDFMNTLLTNLGVCFDVTAGDNGAYRAGLGRDDVTGLGVVDGQRLLAVLTDGIPDPAPVGTVPAPTPVPAPVPVAADYTLAGSLPQGWVEARHTRANQVAAAAVGAWLKAKGLR